MKDLNEKLNRLKEETKPDQSWVASNKSDLFEEKEVFFLFEEVSSKLAFGSMVATIALLFGVILTVQEPVPDYEMVERDLAPADLELIEDVADRMETMEEEDEQPLNDMAVRVEIEDLDETQRKRLIEELEETTAELDREIKNLEERIERVMTVKANR